MNEDNNNNQTEENNSKKKKSISYYLVFTVVSAVVCFIVVVGAIWAIAYLHDKKDVSFESVDKQENNSNAEYIEHVSVDDSISMDYPDYAGYTEEGEIAEIDNTTPVEFDFEENVELLRGISIEVLDEFAYSQYYKDLDTNYISANEIYSEFKNQGLGRAVFNIFYKDNRGGDSVSVDTVKAVINSAFSCDYTFEDIINEADEKGQYYNVDNGMVNCVDIYWYLDSYVGYWIPEEKRYYIESYSFDPAWSTENGQRIPGVQYFKISQIGYVEFAPADNEMGFTINSVELTNMLFRNYGNPWNCYDYHSADDFTILSEVNLDDVYECLTDEDKKVMDEFIPVLNMSESVKIFNNIGDSAYTESLLTDLKVECIGFADINKDGSNEMIMSVWDRDEWKMMVVSHINNTYYGYIFEKYGLMFLAQNGFYYKAPDTNNYSICQMDISEAGIYENTVLTVDCLNMEAYLSDQNISYDMLDNFEYEEIGPTVRFYDVIVWE